MARPPSVVLVNTGDGKGKSSAAFGVMGRGWADTVTEMRNVEHAYDRGIVARRGIEC